MIMSSHQILPQHDTQSQNMKHNGTHPLVDPDSPEAKTNRNKKLTLSPPATSQFALLMLEAPLNYSLFLWVQSPGFPAFGA